MADKKSKRILIVDGGEGVAFFSGRGSGSNGPGVKEE